jgi:hypothetical protein
MLVEKKKVRTIKQHDKGDNVCQSPPDFTQLSKNNSSKNAIKNIFNVDLHHGPGAGQRGFGCQKGWPHSL